MNKNLIHLLNNFIILVLGLVVSLWLQGKLLFFWDEIFPFDPPRDIYHYSFAWFELFNHGKGMASHNILMVPYFFFIFIFYNMLKLSVYTSQFLLIYVLFTLSGITMYYFLFDVRKAIVVQERENSRLISAFSSLMGSLFYMFNLYTIVYLLFDFWPSWFLYALSPLAILLFIRGLDKAANGEINALYVLLFACTLTVMGPGFFQGPYMLYFLFLTVICFVVKISTLNTARFVKILVFLLLIFAVSIATNLWLVGPLLQLSLAQEISLSKGQLWDITVNEALFHSSKQNIFNLLRGLPPHLLPPSPGTAGWSWATLYVTNTFLIFSSLIPIFISSLPLLNLRIFKRGYYVGIYGSLILLLSYGTMLNFPGEFLFRLFFQLKKPSLIYSAFYHFLGFPLQFLFSVSFSNGIFLLGNQCRKFKLKKLNRLVYLNAMLLSAALSIIIYPWPLWTPQATPIYITYSDHIQIPSVTKIPDYYWQMANYLAELPEEGYVLFLPPTPPIRSYIFRDGSGGFIATHDFFSHASGKPTIGFLFTNEDHLYRPLLDAVYENNTKSFFKYLQFLGAKYVLVNAEVGESPGTAGYPFDFKKILYFVSSQPNIKLLKEIGPLYLFEYTGPVKPIYAVNDVVFFSPTLQRPLGVVNVNLSNHSNFVQSPLNAMCMRDIGKVVYYNETNVLRLVFSYGEGECLPDFGFMNRGPLGVNVSKFRYLIINFKNSPRTWIGVDASSDRISKFIPLVPLNPIDPKDGLWQSSTDYYTMVYYLEPRKFENGTLNYINIGLHVANASHLEAFVEIKGLYFAEYIRLEDVYRFVIGSTFDPKQQALVSETYNFIRMRNPVVPQIIYKKINPTLYEVYVKNASSSFMLVLDRHFDENWKALINGKPLDEKNHIMINTYANGWIIEKEGDYVITLIYKEQIYQEVYINISKFSLLISFAVTGLCLYFSKCNKKP